MLLLCNKGVSIFRYELKGKGLRPVNKTYSSTLHEWFAPWFAPSWRIGVFNYQPKEKYTRCTCDDIIFNIQEFEA